MIYIRGHLRVESFHSLCQNNTKLQTHPPSARNVKMQNLSTIDVYNFKYKIILGNIMKLLFLFHKYIDK